MKFLGLTGDGEFAIVFQVDFILNKKLKKTRDTNMIIAFKSSR